ncbi:MAG: hypothetical protein V1784_03220 [bacterium]
MVSVRYVQSHEKWSERKYHYQSRFHQGMLVRAVQWRNRRCRAGLETHHGNPALLESAPETQGIFPAKPVRTSVKASVHR